MCAVETMILHVALRLHCTIPRRRRRQQIGVSEAFLPDHLLEFLSKKPERQKPFLFSFSIANGRRRYLTSTFEASIPDRLSKLWSKAIPKDLTSDFYFLISQRLNLYFIIYMIWKMRS